MRVIGIICELNPLHPGHVRLLKEVKKQVPDSILLAAMSGPLVQRGTLAVEDKWVRARKAVAAGFDLVVEIPLAYVLQSAETFASGGLQTLACLPAVDSLAFGLERPYSRGRLEEILNRLTGEEGRREIKEGLSRGLSYRRTVDQLLGEDLPPNALLALNYLQQLKKEGLEWEVIPIERKDDLPSARAIRERQYPGSDSMDALLPYLRYGRILHPLDLSLSSQFETGMDHRFWQCFDKSGSIDEAIALAANKRQSKARYRRLLWTSLLEMDKKEYGRENLPRIQSIRPLAFNQRGADLLRQAAFPVIQKPADRELPTDQERLFQLNLKAQRLYEEVKGLEAGRDYRQTFYSGS